MKRAGMKLANKRPSKWAKYAIRPEQYPSTPGNKRYERDRAKREGR